MIHAQEILNVSMKDPEHLKNWLRESGRTYLIFDANDLIDSLPWPDGVVTLLQLISCYRDHRRMIPSGEFVEELDPSTGQKVRVPVMKDEVLTLAEMDRAIRNLVTQVTSLDESWSLDSAPL